MVFLQASQVKLACHLEKFWQKLSAHFDPSLLYLYFSLLKKRKFHFALAFCLNSACQSIFCMSNSCILRQGTCTRKTPFLTKLLNFVSVLRKPSCMYTSTSANFRRLVATEYQILEKQKNNKKKIIP